MKRRSFLQKSLLTTGALGLVPGGISFAGNSEPIESFSPEAASPAEGPLDQSLPLRYRQIHLDFHTSGHIPDIGINFDPDEFASTLKKAHVNSVTCFGRCHHVSLFHRYSAREQKIITAIHSGGDRAEVFFHPFVAQPAGEGNVSRGVTVNSRHSSLDAIPFNTSVRAAYYQEKSIGVTDAGATVGALIFEGFYLAVRE